MKNLNKRSAIILAIAGLVVVAVVAVVVFTPVGAGSLIGTAALVITPSNPAIVVGNSTGLSVNAVYNCAWSSSNTAVASLVNYSKETKAVRVKANAPGSATITAKCGFGAINVNHVSTTVTVLAVLDIAPDKPSVILGNTIALSVPAGYNCTWTNSGAASFVGANTGSSVTVRGNTAGQVATITAQCGTWGSTSTSVTVNNLAFSPDKLVRFTGSLVHVEWPTGSIYPCTWTTSSPDIAFLVNNQMTTTPQERAYAVWLRFHSDPWTVSIASITISCGAGQSATLKAKSCWPGDAACLNDQSF